MVPEKLQQLKYLNNIFILKFIFVWNKFLVIVKYNVAVYLAWCLKFVTPISECTAE